MIKPSRISTHEVFRSLLINTFYHLLVNNNEGVGIINFLPLKRVGLLGRGCLFVDLGYDMPF